MDSIHQQIRGVFMNCVVEYMFKEDSSAYTQSPIFEPFPTVDQAISFIDDMKRDFENSIEWIYIHLQTV